jgi:hypothetical protein
MHRRKEDIKYYSANDHCTQTEDVIVNPINPDSKLMYSGNIPKKEYSPISVGNYAWSSQWF